MKVNLNLNNNAKNINFKGYKPLKSDSGNKTFLFNYPHDDKRFICYLEVFNVSEDEKGNYYITDLIEHSDVREKNLFKYPDDKDYIEEKGKKLTPGENNVDLNSEFAITGDVPFAYHYKLYRIDQDGNKTGAPIYHTDNGNVINNRNKNDYQHEIYNLVLQNGAKLHNGGASMLLIPDSYKPGFVYDEKGDIVADEKIYQRAKNSVKTFSNKLGGTLAGIEKGIQDGEFKGIAKLFSTPMFTDDTRTPHCYWNKNNYQMANTLGNVNNYASLQRKLFANGTNLVADAAMVNEGLQGIHFSHVLEYGEKSPFFHWFKVTGLKEGPLSLGIFGKKPDFVGHRLVNSPYSYIQDSSGMINAIKNPAGYNSDKPTYIQFYDTRLVNKDKLNPNALLQEYDYTNTDNSLDINNHNDTIIPYAFKINPEDYQKNIKLLNEHNERVDRTKQIKLDSFEATRILSKFKNWEAEEKFESGMETWDANPDIVKLAFVTSNADAARIRSIIQETDRPEFSEMLKRKNYEVQDYAIGSAQYWTNKTKQILELHIAQNLNSVDPDNPQKVYENIMNLCDDKILPAKLKDDINLNIINNVLSEFGTYKLQGGKSDKPYKEMILSGLMNMPLDAIELGDDILGILSQPAITKRANSEDTIGMSKYELFAGEKIHIEPEHKKAYDLTNKIYTEVMTPFAEEVLELVMQKLPENTPKFNSKDNPDATLYGKYVLPFLTAEIARFAIINALFPDISGFKYNENGEISYNYNKLKETSLKALNIDSNMPEDEAVQLLNKIKRGISKISSDEKKSLSKALAEALAQSLKETNENSFKLAEMIVDRSGAGLDWRIDATKDIADFESYRNKETDLDTTINYVTAFWKKFAQSVLKDNPNAYFAAEITDEMDQREIVRKFLQNTGITTTANYSYFFSDIPRIFGKSFESNEGTFNEEEAAKLIFNKMTEDITPENDKKKYIHSSSLESILYSYTFVDNHDKPRALHGLAMDMGLFYTNLNDRNNTAYRKTAYKLVNDKILDEVSEEEVNRYNFSLINSKAIAMGDALNSGFGNAFKFLHENKKITQERKDEVCGKIYRALSDLSKGTYLNENFEAEAFGVKPFDVTIDLVLNQAKEVHGLDLSAEERKLITDKTFELILKPATEKLKAIMKFLVALPGNPAIFAGDDLGSTGYEEKTKNIYLQNRNFIHHEWVDPDSSEKKDFIVKYKKEMKDVMALRKNPNLRALNDGSVHTLKMQYDKGGKAVSAILRQSPDGAMAISLFNTHKIHNKEKQIDEIETLYLNEINLDSENNIDIGLRTGLREGIEFTQANNEKAKFIVEREGDNYFIKNHDNGPIIIDDVTMVLYYAPPPPKKETPEEVSEEATKGIPFTGRRKVLYNPQYNIVSNPYNQTKNKTAAIGSKLQLLSK